MTKSNIAANLRRYMKLSNTTKTIEQLSDKAGIGKSTLSNILNERSDSSISILDKLAKALEITTDKLLAPKPELKSLRFRTMKTMKHPIICAAMALISLCSFAEGNKKVILPDATILYSVRDTCELYLDIYHPSKGSDTRINGIQKPAVLFMFGGGFMSGARDEASYTPWFKSLTEKGYSVISIDYRLGLTNMKNPGLNKGFIEKLLPSIDIAVEDLYNATAWLIGNGDKYGIDAGNMVICGSSAGSAAIMELIVILVSS